MFLTISDNNNALPLDALHLQGKGSSETPKALVTSRSSMARYQAGLRTNDRGRILVGADVIEADEADKQGKRKPKGYSQEPA